MLMNGHEIPELKCLNVFRRVSEKFQEYSSSEYSSKTYKVQDCCAFGNICYMNLWFSQKSMFWYFLPHVDKRQKYSSDFW
jgi:hypothetical protein